MSAYMLTGYGTIGVKHAFLSGVSSEGSANDTYEVTEKVCVGGDILVRFAHRNSGVPFRL
jgi:hypothetical protein